MITRALRRSSPRLAKVQQGAIARPQRVYSNAVAYISENRGVARLRWSDSMRCLRMASRRQLVGALAAGRDRRESLRVGCWRGECVSPILRSAFRKMALHRNTGRRHCCTREAGGMPAGRGSEHRAAPTGKSGVRAPHRGLNHLRGGSWERGGETLRKH